MLGSGYPPAASIAKFLVNPALSVKENAYRIAGWIREKVDSNVGGIPQVAMIKDNRTEVEYLTEAEVEEAAKRGEQARENFSQLLGLEKG